MSGDELPRFIKSTSKQWRNLKPLAREMRHEPTLAEDVLWQHLCRSQLKGTHFRRQHAIGPFIVDFVCLRHRLIIEVDGCIHDLHDQFDYDQQRQAYLEAHNYRVVRFSNDEILRSIDAVIYSISQELGV